MFAQLLATPWFAVLAGLSIGVGLFVPLSLSSRLPDRSKADVGIFAVVGTVFGGMIVALILLLGYRLIAPAGVAYFGIALCGGYLGSLAVYIASNFKRLIGSDNDVSGETRR